MTAIITRDDLRILCPSVVATSPWEGMSPSCRFIPTADVLDVLEGQGFRVASARQSRTRIPGKAPFTRHMLRLRHESFTGAEDEVPEVVLFNSHDRSSDYKLYAGVHRFACENGMIVKAADFGSFAICDSGSRDLFAQVRGATARIMEEAPAIMGRIEAWKKAILPRSARLDFAREAMALKPNASIPSAWQLTARREEDRTLSDASRDLWRAFNCVQESLLRGGPAGRDERGRKITSRPVKAVDADLRINR